MCADMVLTLPERALVKAAEDGVILNLSAAQSSSIRARVIRQLMLSRLTSVAIDPNGVRLCGATIVGALDLQLAVSTIPLVLNSCKFDATIDLSGSSLRHVDLTGSVMTSASGPAINGERMVVSGSFFAQDGLTATSSCDGGTIHLRGAHIFGELNASGATLINNGTGPALDGERLTVDGGLFLHDRTKTTSSSDKATIHLRGAHISGELNASGATLTNNGTGPALDGERLTVDGDLKLAKGFTPSSRGIVALSLDGATCSGLFVDPPTFSSQRQIMLKGVTYRSGPTGDTRAWRDLLRYATPSYAAQPYQHLASIYSGEGHLRDQREILVAQQDDRRDRILKPATSVASGWNRASLYARRLGLRMNRAVIGYGYRPWKAAIWLLLVLLGAVVAAVSASQVHDAPTDHRVAYVLSSVRSSDPTRSCSSAEQIGLALRIGIPLLANVAEGNCQLDTASRSGELFAAAAALLEGLSWATATIAIGGYAALIKR